MDAFQPGRHRVHELISAAKRCATSRSPVADNTASIQLHSATALNPGEEVITSASARRFSRRLWWRRVCRHDEPFHVDLCYARRAERAAGPTSSWPPTQLERFLHAMKCIACWMQSRTTTKFPRSGFFIRKGTYYGIGVSVMADKGHIHFTGERPQAKRSSPAATTLTQTRPGPHQPARYRAMDEKRLHAGKFDGAQPDTVSRFAGRGAACQRQPLRLEERRVLQFTGHAVVGGGRRLCGRTSTTSRATWISSGNGHGLFRPCAKIKGGPQRLLSARRANPEDWAGYIFNHVQTDGGGRRLALRARAGRDLDRFPYSSVTFINCQMGHQVPSRRLGGAGGILSTSHLQVRGISQHGRQDGKLIDAEPAACRHRSLAHRSRGGGMVRSGKSFCAARHLRTRGQAVHEPMKSLKLQCATAAIVLLSAFVLTSCATHSGTVAGSSATIFNVRDLGAKGDGTTFDTAAIQKALDACTNSGGTVEFPAGIYFEPAAKAALRNDSETGRGRDVAGEH